jgi:anti-sigma B factor antagonist
MRAVGVREQLATVDGTLRPDGVAVVWLRGEVDLSNAREVEYAILAEAGGASEVVLDLSRVDYFDSTGMSVLYRLYKRLDGRLRLVASPSALVRRTLELAGIELATDLPA